ncbi:hypothetical protein SSX86_028651 [Deinandra increscens subsp. villosa]|uniref:Transmembrane protein n=1 Tax=Deinandra increscens subsp. villosa TaxID=3103831 RepID=A0AAP0CB60_9ASTR
MGHFRFRIMLFCFFFAGILIFRSTASRPIHNHMSVKREVESKGALPAALAPASPSSSPVESPSGSEEEDDEQTVHTEKNHHSSVAGGGVIIGGLVTVAFAAVFCYIRVTRKRDGEEH